MKQLTVSQMRNMLVNAFEGGSNSWYMIEDHILPAGATIEDFCKGGRYQPKGGYHHWSQLVPTVPGGALLVKGDDHGGIVALNLTALKAGAKVMRDKYPRNYLDIIEGNDDSETGDIFLQCAMYGELIYC